jgi:hypothetical protein
MASHHQLMRAALVGLAISAFGCQGPDHELARSIEASARHGDVAILDMSETAAFPWDRLFVFEPYTSSEEVERELGRSWWHSDRIEMFDTFTLLVFVKGDRVVRFVDQPLGTGFAGCSRKGGFPRESARFRCVTDGTGRTCRPERALTLR